MQKIDLEEATKKFMDKLHSGGYTSPRAKNSALDYSKIKEDRDTEAVHRFLDTDLFKFIENIK